MDDCHDGGTLDNSFVRPTRFVRDSNIRQESTALQSRKEPTFHDFILLATRIRPADVHYGGHRTDIILTGSSPVIGHGSSFAVYRLPTSENCNGFRANFVAVKSPLASQQINVNSDSFKRQLKDAYFELQVLSHTPLRNHRNIVELLGIFWEPSPVSLASFEGSLLGPLSFWPVLILEYSSQGTILEMFEDIVEYDNDPLTIETKINISLDVARGLKALHDCGIAHSDIKCQNILMFLEPPRLTAKIADFGCALSNLGDELMLADVYSLGFVIWRILTDGADPFASPNVIIARGQLSLKDFKLQDHLWKLASTDTKDHQILHVPATPSQLSGVKSQPPSKSRLMMKSLKRRLLKSKKEDATSTAKLQSESHAAHDIPLNPMSQRVAQELHNVFQNCLRTLPSARNMSLVLTHLIKTQNM
jgi:serine/threonine protein kinase